MLPSEDGTVIQKNVGARQTANVRVARRHPDLLTRVNVSGAADEIVSLFVPARRIGMDPWWGEKVTLISLPPRNL